MNSQATQAAYRAEWPGTIPDGPAIYVACLASYNAGILHGRWIDATQGVDRIQDDINAMLRASPEPNVLVNCLDCETGRRGMGCIQGSSLNVSYPCETCAGTGKVPSAEEYAIHDYANFGPHYKPAEYSGLDEVATIAEAIEEHGQAYAAFLDYRGGLEYASVEQFQDAYQGQHRNRAEWAEDYAESCGLLESVPENLRYYFDYDAWARDAEMNGDVCFLDDDEGGIYAFWNH